MATITHAEAFFQNSETGHAYDVMTLTWATMGNADTGTAAAVPSYSDKTVHITGTFGSATVTIQGSNDNVNWTTLTDIQGTALAVTADDISLIAENPLYIRPITAGGTGTDVDVIISARKK